jgi:hypothetical protein
MAQHAGELRRANSIASGAGHTQLLAYELANPPITQPIARTKAYNASEKVMVMVMVSNGHQQGGLTRPKVTGHSSSKLSQPCARVPVMQHW